MTSQEIQPLDYFIYACPSLIGPWTSVVCLIAQISPAPASNCHLLLLLLPLLLLPSAAELIRSIRVSDQISSIPCSHGGEGALQTHRFAYPFGLCSLSSESFVMRAMRLSFTLDAHAQVTTMVMKVNLGCERCYKKIKRVLCRFPGESPLIL